MGNLGGELEGQAGLFRAQRHLNDHLEAVRDASYPGWLHVGPEADHGAFPRQLVVGGQSAAKRARVVEE